MTTVKKIAALAVLLLLAACGPTIENDAPALRELSPWPFANRYLTAVFPFAYHGTDEKMAAYAGGLADMCVDEMFRSKRFRIVERSRIDAVLKEIGLSQAGVIDESRAGDIGKQLGAELILVGSVEEIRPLGKKDSIGIAWKESRGFEVSLKGRLIDVTRGEVVAVARATAREVQTRKVALGTSTGGIAADKTLITRAMEKAAAALINDLAADAPMKKAA